MTIGKIKYTVLYMNGMARAYGHLGAGFELDYRGHLGSKQEGERKSLGMNRGVKIREMVEICSRMEISQLVLCWRVYTK